MKKLSLKIKRKQITVDVDGVEVGVEILTQKENCKICVYYQLCSTGNVELVTVKRGDGTVILTTSGNICDKVKAKHLRKYPICKKL